MPNLPDAFWILLIAGPVALSLWWWALLGAPRWRRQRRMDATARDWAQRYGPLNAMMAAALQRAVSEADEALRSSRIPKRLRQHTWCLCLSEPAANLLDLLASALPTGPAGRDRSEVAGSGWRWWLFEQIAAIELHPLPIDPDPAHEELGLHALRALAMRRPEKPLDCCVLFVSCTTLLADPAVAQPVMAQLWRQAEQAAAVLGMRLPVYLLVTGLERLDGFETFRLALPLERRNAVLGGRLQSSRTRSVSPSEDLLKQVCAPLIQQLEAFRLEALRQTNDRAAHRDLHFFVEAMQSLQPSLFQFISDCLAPPSKGSAALWRGLYFAASPAQSTLFADLWCAPPATTATPLHHSKTE